MTTQQPAKNKEAMLTISMGFLVLYVIFHWQWCLIVSLTIGILGVFSSWISARVAWGWFGLAQILGKIVSTILLTVIFFVFLTPIAFAFKLFNKDPLKIKPGYPSYFVARNIIFTRESFEKPW